MSLRKEINLNLTVNGMGLSEDENILYVAYSTRLNVFDVREKIE
jgi:sugar lactone lactonase YvrE